MSRLISFGLMAAAAATLPFAATAQTAPGTVTEYTGEYGDFIVSRDGVSYSLSTGEDLMAGDIIRATAADTATITYDGCTYTIPAGQDITLDDAFCEKMASLENPAPETTTVETPAPRGEIVTASGVNTPLVIGGVVVAAGGIAAAAGGDSDDSPSSP